MLYLVFNEGYAATSGDGLVRRELCAEAIRLTRTVVSLLPDEPEATGLLALMLLHDARREARVGPGGELILLDDQDRDRWDAERIAEGQALVDRALAARRPGPYQVQAAIAALHDEAIDPAETDWPQIADALPDAPADGALAGRRAQPGGRRRDGRRPGGRARDDGRHRRLGRARRLSRTCTPAGRTSCAGSGAGPKPRRPTGAPWR